jgi:predicted ATP-grasp superfamily ATP-dependent carboligase
VTAALRVLVLDGEQRAALAAVRSLGRRGCQVHVGSAVAPSLAGSSRFAASDSRVTDPLAGSDRYAAAVSKLARDTGAALILPVTEASSMAVLERRESFGDAVIPMTDLARFRLACDKAAVLGIAASLGINVPSQWTISGHPGTGATVPADRYPVVVKPARSLVGPEGARRKVGVLHTGSPDQLEQVLGQLGPEAGPFLIQARVEGPGLGVFLLRWEGRIVASFAHQRIREKPPSGGVSVCCESVAPPRALLAQSVALLEAIDWEGVAMIEFKHDHRSGRTFLMEINPRFWGSLQLAIDAGVDFPWYLVQVALGQPVAPVMSWRVGVRSRWRFGELDNLIARLRHSPVELGLPADDPGLVRTAASVLLPWRPRQRSEVFRLDDPGPGIREALDWVRAL